MYEFKKCCGSHCWWPVLLLLTLSFGIPAAYGQSSVADELAQSISQYSSGFFEEGIASARSQLSRPGLTPADRAAVYSVLSMIYYAKGEDSHQKAFDYLDKIMDVGPCVTHLPFNFWPNILRDRWYRMANDAGQLVCDAKTDPAIKTIAIMEFDNFSTGKYQEKLGYVTKGLSDFFEADFAALNNLKVVERDKIDFILKEIAMSKKGLVDEATAVRAGKLLGAQIMVFGSVVQMDGKNARMIVKAVKVETSEIIATAERTGKPEFFTMEQELVKDLAAKLDLELNPEAKEALEANGAHDNDAAELYSRGLSHVDKYEYAEAFDYFKKAYEMDSTFGAAKKKMDIYRPLAMSS